MTGSPCLTPARQGSPQAAAAGIRSLEIPQGRARQTIPAARANAAKMMIRAPMDEIVVLNDIRLTGKMGLAREGTEVRPGTSSLRVVDTSRMDVGLTLNQADLPSLRIGQHGVVRLDASPELSFPGAIEELDPLGLNQSDPRLRPGMDGVVRIAVERVPNGILVPAQALFRRGGSRVAYVLGRCASHRAGGRRGPLGIPPVQFPLWAGVLILVAPYVMVVSPLTAARIPRSALNRADRSGPRLSASSSKPRHSDPALRERNLIFPLVSPTPHS